MIFLVEKEGFMRLNVDGAIECLLNGQVIGIVTDTVIGFATLENNCHKIYEIKERDLQKPLIQMVSKKFNFVETNSEIEALMDKSWPGATTIIYPIQGIQTSFRIPNEPTLLELLEKIEVSIFTTSANKSGEEPCKTLEEFEDVFPDINILIPSGEINLSQVPSSIYIYEEKQFRRVR